MTLARAKTEECPSTSSLFVCNLATSVAYENLPMAAVCQFAVTLSTAVRAKRAPTFIADTPYTTAVLVTPWNGGAGGGLARADRDPHSGQCTFCQLYGFTHLANSLDHWEPNTQQPSRK